MKQWKQDKENPALAKERDKKSSMKKEKVSKKIKIAAMSVFHGIPIEKLVK